MKPWQYWLIFGACFGVVLLAMGGISFMALSLDRRQAQAAHVATYEENVRLALWRMESALSPMLARESSRPHASYSSFHPAERAYTRMYDDLGRSEILLPSPLLTESVPHILLHFQLDPEERLTSPEVPTARGREAAIAAFNNGELIDRATVRLHEFEARIDHERLLVEVLGRRPPKPADLARKAAVTPREETVAEADLLARQETSQAASPSAAVSQPMSPLTVQPQIAQQEVAQQADQIRQQRAAQEPVPVKNAPAQGMARQAAKNVSEWSSRAQLQQKAMQNVQMDQMVSQSAAPLTSPYGASANRTRDTKAEDRARTESQRQVTGGSQAAAPAATVQTRATVPAAKGGIAAKAAAPKERPKQAPPDMVHEGTMKPLWLGDLLLLARRTTVNGREYVQGCWLDWRAIRAELLQQVQDLLPAANLVPAIGAERNMEGRLLAGLPLRLVPGRMPHAPPNGMTPVRVALVIAWACVLIAAGAVGILLAGAVSLSERRASFVSAVTHELRTPLTTFRMYAEMLADGMVPDESARNSYLATLCAEGNRLSHLVENVLAYARLERGRARGHLEWTTAGAIVERLRGRLEQRAAQAELSLVVDTHTEADTQRLRTDVSVVEQVLFNLVDNACKYAADGNDRRLHLETAVEGGRACLRVRDHGPGIPADDAKRLFRPFSKSAKHAAETAPGVGLGLALSRRLARQMGGDLRICPGVTDGACFELLLPAGPR